LVRVQVSLPLPFYKKDLISHYNTLKTELRNKKNLIKALVRRGWKEENIEVHDEAQNLVDYQGDKRNQKAEIIIRRKYVGGASNDMGFKLQSDGTYQAIISDFDRNKYGDQFMKNLELDYGVEQTKDAFTMNGWQFQESTDEKGNVVLLGQVYEGSY
jgi:hypothetical protein